MHLPGLAFLRATVFSIGMILATVIWAPLCVLTFPLPHLTRYRFVSRWCAFVVWWLEITCGVHAEVEGRENLPKRTVVVVPKHSSTWETLFLTTLFEPLLYVVKKELLWVPFFGWGLAVVRPIAIDRSAGRSAMAQVLEQGTEKLNKGCSICIFPEGTRVPVGKRRRYGMGAILLAKESGAPLVPIAHNAGQFWARRSFLKKSGTIRLVIGTPIDPSSYDAEALREMTESWIEETTERLTGITATQLHGK